MFLRLKYFSIQNRSTISGFAFRFRQLILYRLLGCRSIHLHQLEHRQKAKTDVVCQPQLLQWPYKKVAYISHGNGNSFNIALVDAIQPKIRKGNKFSRWSVHYNIYFQFFT